MNFAGLAVIAWVFGRDYPAAVWAAIGGAAMVAIGTGLLLLSPQVDWYVGLSGVLHAALAAGVVSWWRRGARWSACLLAFALAGKLVYEQWLGASALVAGLPVVVDAHLYGAVAGLLTALLLRAVVATDG